MKQAVAASAAVTPATARILLVDDREENLFALEAILDDLDATLVRARSGSEALRLLLAPDEEFALILLDVQMPDIDGYGTARLVRLRPKTAHVPIIFISAIDRDEHHALRGYGLGAVDFMAKPFNPEVLRAKASVFIELYRLREAHRAQAEALQASEARRLRRTRHATLRADVGEAFGRPGELPDVLLRCVEACITHLDAAYARAWLADPHGEVLALAAHTGTTSSFPAGHRTVKVGDHKVGHVAATRQPHLTNDLLNDPRLGDPTWATQEGLTAYAGYPLVVDDQLIGVIDVLAREGLQPDTLEALEAVSQTMAQGIARKQLLTALASRNEQLGERNEELGALNEELAAQSEELLAQQTELMELNARLADQKAEVEREVQARTEDLSSANEELAAQAEELEAQNLELVAMTDRMLSFERQKARVEALEQADRQKDQFLGILSHELRTPLNAIQGFGSVLEDGIAGDLNEAQARYVGKILASSDAMLALVDDLLDLSRVQVGKFSLDRAPGPVAGIAREAFAQVEPLATTKGCTLVDALPEDLPEADMDPVRVRQVLANLLTNAVKFTPPGGRIVMGASHFDGVLRFEVADDGEGIAPEEHDRIFVPFTQVDMSPTRAKGGVGLGLSIVRAIVHAHGGDCGVTSKLGQGSTFWFTLPLAQLSVR